MKIKDIITEARKSWGAAISDVLKQGPKVGSYWVGPEYEVVPGELQEPIQQQEPVDKQTGNEKPTQEKPKVKTAPKATTGSSNVNATLKSKIEYLIKTGKLASARITDDEKRYIDSVDVYVDPDRFAGVDPSEKFIKSKPPHHSLATSSVQIPMSEWQRALGREGGELSGYVSFDLTPAGWWSDDFKAYVNPNNKLDDLITSYQKG